MKPGTARKVQVVLSSILSEGVELGLVRENVAARMKMAPSPRHDMTILTAEEVRAVAEAMSRPSDRLAIYVAAYTGLRAGELWALRRRDIDLDARRLTVARALKDAHGRLEFGDTKTDRSRRVVSLPTFLVNMLAAHFDASPAQNAEALVFTAPGGGNGRTDGDGGPVRHGLFVRRYFKPAVARDLPAAKAGLRFHDLRHTCASLLIHDGASILLVQTRLGHSSATTTMDRYGHLYPSAEAALADALDATTTQATRTSSRSNATRRGRCSRQPRAEVEHDACPRGTRSHGSPPASASVRRPSGCSQVASAGGGRRHVERCCR